MATIVLLDQCYDASKFASALEKDVDDIFQKLAEVQKELQNSDSSFKNAFLLGNKRPLNSFRNEILSDISESLVEIQKYKKAIIKNFWSKRLSDLQTYREYLTSEISNYTSEQDKLLKSMQKESNYKGIQSSNRYSDYLQLKNDLADLRERLELCKKEITAAEGMVRAWSV